MSGVERVASEASLKDLTVENAQLSTVYALNNTVAGQDADLTVQYQSTTGTADTAKVAINNAGDKTVSATTMQTILLEGSAANSIEAITIDSLGTNYVSVGGGTAVGTITVNGSGKNAITLDSAKSTMLLDASAATGNNTLTVGTLLSTADTIKGGSGTDQLNGTVSSAGQYLTTVSGVETLELDFTAAGIYNFQNTTGVTEVQVNLSDDATLSNVTTSVATIAIEETTKTAKNVTATYKAGTSSDVAVVIGATDTDSTTTVAVDVGNVTVNGTSGTVKVTSVGEADNLVDALSFDKAVAVEVTAFSKGLTNAGTTTLSKASTITFNAEADDLTFTDDITASVDVDTVKFLATGSGNELLVDGAAGAFTGNRSIADIQVVAAAAGAVTIDQLTWKGKDVDANAVSTTVEISADADSTVTISSIAGNGEDVTISNITLSGAGDVNIGTGTKLGNTVNITEVVSTMTGSLSLTATDIDTAMTVTLGNAATNEKNVITTGGAADYVAGGTGIDQVVLGAGADVFISNGGKDTVTGGAGNDNITFGTGVQTAVFVSGGATTIADYNTANGSDTLVSFATGTGGDVIKFEQALKSIDATTTIAYQVGAKDTAIADGTTVYELAGSTTDGTAQGLVTGLGTAATNTSLAQGDALVFVNYTTAGDAQLWYFVETGAATAVSGAELTLIGTLTSVTADSFAVGNITA